MLNFPTSLTNDPTRKGQLAARKQLFGDHKRYAVAPIHTRFGELTWFVWDAQLQDDNGSPVIIRQEATPEAAIAGLAVTS